MKKKISRSVRRMSARTSVVVGDSRRGPAILAANWKMYLRTGQAEALAATLTRYRFPSSIAPTVFPSFPALPTVVRELEGTAIAVGAQDVAAGSAGTSTGEVSADDLRSLGCRSVILGHSERRALGETDLVIRKKLIAALSHGLSSILCVGESRHERIRHAHHRTVAHQVIEAMRNVPPAHRGTSLIVAYEPVWAVGSDEPATPEQAVDMAGVIRTALAEVLPSSAADRVNVLYGGSVTPTNVSGFVDGQSINGVLLGRAALTARGFLDLAEALIAK